MATLKEKLPFYRELTLVRERRGVTRYIALKRWANVRLTVSFSLRPFNTITG
jgi:hypothetical protein